MSLPSAPKDTSEHPQKGAVTSPVDPKMKDADVDRKLRFYGVIEAFRQGRMPDNAQIDSALLYTRENSPVNVSQLSAPGKRLIDDVRDVIETARQIVKEKNADELLQEFVWETRNTNWDSHNVGKDDVPLTKEQAQQHGQTAVQHLRTLLHLLLTNSEARKLITDSGVIGRDLLSIGASKAAGAIAPSRQQLENVDNTAPNDEFKTAPGTNEPVLQERIPGTDHKFTSHPKEGVSVTTAGGETKTPGQLKEDATQVGQAALQEGGNQAQAHAQDVQRERDVAPEGEEGDATKRTLKEKIAGVRDNLFDRVPQEHKDRANDQLDRSKQFFSEEYFPQERRDQFLYRGKKVIIECQKHPDYQESLRWLLDYTEQYASHGKTLAKTGAGGADNLTSDPALSTGLGHFRLLLERFANGQSAQPILDSIQQIGNDAREDAGLRQWLKDVDTYIRRLLLEAGYVLQPDSDRAARELTDNGRQYWDGKYRAHFDNIFDRIGTFFGAMGDDVLNKRLGDDLGRLSRDILFDAEGKLTYKPELWQDIRKVILPSIIERVGYVPIPRIEYTDDGLDLVVENLTLSGPNLFPNIVTIEAHNFIKFSPYDAVKDDSHHDLTLTFSHIQADLRDVAFYFRRKTTPKLSDSGLADIILGGQGLTVTAHVRSAPTTDTKSAFYVKSVDAKLGDIKVAIRDSKHDLLYKTLKPLMMGLIKKQIKKAVEDAIRTGLEYVDGQLVGVQQRMRDAKADDDGSRVQVLQDIFKKKTDAAGSVKSKADSHFQIGAKRDSGLLPDQGHPAGWANRATERSEAATVGDRWKSKAFTIV